MTRTLLLGLCFVAFAAPSFAQTDTVLPQSCNIWWSSAPGCPYYDQTPLGKAMSICADHSSSLSRVYAANPPQTVETEYAPDWQQDCKKVSAKWAKTEAAKKERKVIEREKRDRAFVHAIANSEVRVQ